MSEKQELVKVDQQVATQGFEFDVSKGIPYLEAVAERMIESGFLKHNITEVGQVIAIGQMGHELGISWMTAMNYINNIQGAATLSYPAVGALLKRNGYGIKILKNMEPDETGNYITSIRITDYTLQKEYEKKLDKAASYQGKLQEQYLRSIVNMEENISRDFVFTWSDAIAAGYPPAPGEKPNQWSKYPRNMLFARCLTNAVRALCPQVMMGFYETQEMADANGITTDINEETMETVEAEIVN